jgi:acyl-CoA thioester hydrolase
MENPQFSYDFEVRDYECDLQGIVNNSRYQNYLEHTRHMFLKSRGLDFAEITVRGIYLIVTRIEIDYKFPLRSGDEFTVYLRMSRKGRVRWVFDQEVVRKSDNKLIIQAKVIGAAMNAKGRPVFPRELEEVLPEDL